MSTIIRPTTAAVPDSDAFFIDARGGTLSADALAEAETIAVHYSGNGGVTWTPLYDGGEAVTLTATQPQIILAGAGKYRCAKDSTVNECGVYISR